MLWSGWGDPAAATSLPPATVELVRAALRLGPGSAPAVALAEVRVPESAAPARALEDLRGVVGAAAVLTDHETRVRHTRGRSTSDLIRLRRGDGSAAPDAVVLPASHGEVVGVLEVCARHRLAAVAYGGGTSVVGGLGAERGDLDAAVAVDLARLDRLVAIDAVSRTATLEPGLRGPAAEALLGAHGLTLGHFPQSFEYATLGGFAATRSSGQASAGYGRFDDLVVALRLATPRGTWELGRAPRSAAGPDLRQLVLGSEGTLGIITALTLQVRPAPQRRVHEAWRLPRFAAGVDAVRMLAQDGPRLTVLRLSDEAETALGIAARPGAVGEAPDAASGCLLVAGHEGGARAVDEGSRALADALGAVGGTPLGTGPGDSWARERFRGGYLRDALLDLGAFVETLETATFWSGLEELYARVGAALRTALGAAGTPPLVLCHVSHVYPAGASLYFTVACAQGDDPLAGWRRAKAAASEAIVACGATISHHHGVGSDHRGHMRAEVGALGVDVLRAVKAALDPVGVLNPGVLIP